MSLIKQVPTNVITGFLGVGKTTAIMHLMKSKPADERWAVLVNEFGEVGIDGSIFEGSKGKQQGLYVREVPGGCMCCAAGIPMQIALNMLIAKAKPHRLLIEPTGLGHPKEVLATLRGEHYREVLDIQRTVTLVDARKLTEPRYVEHEIFQQQLALADVIVANKKELYSELDYPYLQAFLLERFPDHPKTVHQVSQGEISIDWLRGAPAFLPTVPLTTSSSNHRPKMKDEPAEEDALSVSETGIISKKNQGEGFFSQGWIFESSRVFNKNKVVDLLKAEKAERLKAVFITHLGVFAFNKVDEHLSEKPLDDATESRIEIISKDEEQLAEFEQKLLNCQAELP